MKNSLLAGLLLASVASAKTLTLEQVLSAPFPSELIAAPGGGRVAWLLNERGARNIWIAAAPDFKGARLTNYAQDDGQDVGQLQWTPDAKAVVYVRGGGGQTPIPRQIRMGSISPFGSLPPVKRRARSVRGTRPWCRPRATGWPTFRADRSGWRPSPAEVLLS